MNSANCRQPLLTTLYQTYIPRHDIRTFIFRTEKNYNESSLSRLTGSSDTETRRAAALALGFLGSYQSNDSLGRLLRDRDRSVRLLAESSLKSIWSREGTEEQRRTLHCVMRLIAAQKYGEAVSCANVLLDEFPFYIEARNQRAIALFALKQFEYSIEDSRVVLDLNPYHFGAAIGMGHAFLQLNNTLTAIDCFQQALTINPNLDSIRSHVERLILNPW